jgi:hypothetical protein
MFRRFPLFASMVFLLLSAAASAQDRNSMPTLNQAIRGQWLQFSIIGGRINLDGSRIDNIETGVNNLSQKDLLNIRVENGETSMTYEWSNAKEQVSLNAGGCRLHLRRGPKVAAEDHKQKLDDKEKPAVEPGKPDKAPEPKSKEKKVLVDFTQTPGKKSVFILEIDGKQQVFAAAGLWHFFILYPEESRKYLAPLLQLLQPTWKLADQAAGIETELLRNTNYPIALDRSNWAHWVAQLGDESFARREAADRALRTANPALLVYLQQLDADHLDAEQQFRIRRIVELLSLKINNDAPEQAAAWLACDPSIWLALLNRPDVSTRRIAAKQLAAILEGPISVDPEADPASQKAQFDKLRARIELPGELEKK